VIIRRKLLAHQVAAFLAPWFVIVCFGLPQKVVEKHEASGLLLSADTSRHTITVSCNEIPGHMEAMVMTFAVKDPKWPEGLKPGVKVAFTLIVEKGGAFAEGMRVIPFESLELDPTEARRLKLLENATSAKPPSADVLPVGAAVPNFRLIDQLEHAITLSDFYGKVVALTFIYTRCPLPDYCVRLSNNFGILQRRFEDRMGTDLVLLTVVIDPVHDKPDALKEYARTWNANVRSWHFLTGSAEEIQQLCRRFDMSYYPDEALFVHSFHTVLIGRSGRLVANLEGNSFTSQQLGDLVQTVLAERD